MQTEFEAKSIKIHKDDIRQKLKEQGAELVFEETKFKRMIFDLPVPVKDTWIRLRTESDGDITLALKSVKDETNIEGMKEVSFGVSDFEAVVSFLNQIGLKSRNFQENLREEWKLNGIIFDIDTWPLIDPYLEIEAESEEEVKRGFKLLGLDYSKAHFTSSDVLYRDVYDIDILGMSELVF